MKQEGETLWVVFERAISLTVLFICVYREADAGSASGIYIATVFSNLSKVQAQIRPPRGTVAPKSIAGICEFLTILRTIYKLASDLKGFTVENHFSE